MSKSATSIPKPKISYSVLVGRVVEHHRKQQGVQQTEMAEAMGISQSAYSRLEKGESAMNVTQLLLAATRLSTTSAAILQQAELLAKKMRAQGVEVANDNEVSVGGLLIALGILAALLAASG